MERVEAQDTIIRGVSFRDNAEQAEKLAQGLVTTINREIERLRDERSNDPTRQADIDFLEMVSATLDEIIKAIQAARQATTSQDREKWFAKAEVMATHLAKAGQDFAERNYERIVDYGGLSLFTILGTQFFAMMFGVPYSEALATQLTLLGLSSIKK